MTLEYFSHTDGPQMSSSNTTLQGG